MRIRDILIVVVALLAIIFGWLQEGTIVIQNSFSVHVGDSDALVHQGPPPVVTDLNGDGKPETLMLPMRDMLAVFPTGAIKRSFDNVFAPLMFTNTASMSTPIIGFAAGHLTYPNNASTTTMAPRQRRQHVAVVTDDYRLTMLNHKLDEVWSISLIPVSDAIIIPFHASIMMLPERIFEQDLGCVVVGIAVGGPNSTERMAFFGVNGATGEVRWKRTLDSFAAVDKLALERVEFQRVDRLILSDSDLAERSNEMDWNNFRESMMAALPHSYSHPWDDQMHPHHFFRAKGRRKNDRQQQQHGSSSGGAPGAAADSNPSVKYKSRYVQHEGNSVGELGEHLHILHKAATGAAEQELRQRHRLHPNVLVHHSKAGLHVIHLYTGKVVTRLMPLRQRVAYHDLDDDYDVDEVSFDVGARQVHHHRHGMDEEVRCHGVVASGIPFTENPTFNTTICDTEGLFSSMSLLTHFIRGDGAEDQPRADPLSLIGSRNIGSQFTRAATPLVIQLHSAKGVNLWKVSRRAVFFIDTGLLTCISSVSKQVIWRAQTDATFDGKRDAEEVSGGIHSADELDNRVRRHPHLASYSFHTQAPAVRSARTMHYLSDPYVLAVGNQMIVAVNARNGQVSRSVRLPSPPIAPVIVADFNGDGTNDIIATTEAGYYGFIVKRQTGGSTISILMFTTIALLALLYGAQVATQDADDDHDQAASLGAHADEGAGEFHFTRSSGKYRVPTAKRSTD